MLDRTAANRGSPKGTALVTGASDRIGAAIAKTLARAGYCVIVHYRASADGARNVVDQITSEGGKAAPIQADLADRSARGNLISNASALFGPLNLLVNNASSFEPDSIADLSEVLWDSHFAVHVEAPVFLARDFAAQLPEAEEGNIVNIIDERVLQLSPAYLSYTLSKSALWTATRTLAQSLAPRIRVNAIGPGPTLRAEGQSEEQFQRAIAALPLQRGASAEAIGLAVLFLLATPSMTGQMLALDGGKHLSFPATRAKTPRRS